MSYIISPSKQLAHFRGYTIVLMLTAIGLGACMIQQELPSATAPIKLTPSPTKSLLPTKPPPPVGWQYRWLNGVPCLPPCWEGVTPGKTTAAEAVEIWGGSPVIATVEIFTPRITPNQGIVEWTWIEGTKGGEAIFHSQIQSSTIYLIYPYFPTSFKFRDVIQAYGEPSHIIAKAFPRPDSEGVDYDLRILYRSQGFILLEQGVSKPVLNEDTPFGSVGFFALNDEGLQAALGGAADHPDWVVPWQGMKDYDYYCTDIKGNPCP